MPRKNTVKVSGFIDSINYEESPYISFRIYYCDKFANIFSKRGIDIYASNVINLIIPNYLEVNKPLENLVGKYVDAHIQFKFYSFRSNMNENISGYRLICCSIK